MSKKKWYSLNFRVNTGSFIRSKKDLACLISSSVLGEKILILCIWSDVSCYFTVAGMVSVPLWNGTGTFFRPKGKWLNRYGHWAIEMMYSSGRLRPFRFANTWSWHLKSKTSFIVRKSRFICPFVGPHSFAVPWWHLKTIINAKSYTCIFLGGKTTGEDYSGEAELATPSFYILLTSSLSSCFWWI